jgi:pyruvate-formate lyase-activating enzyme
VDISQPLTTPDAIRSLRVNPYLHVGADSIFNPHADATLSRRDAGYKLLRELLGASNGRASGHTEATRNRPPGAPSVYEALLADRWLVAAGDDPDLWYRLKYVSLEAHTVCNQACYFCPVSVAPRAAHQMSMELYARIVGEIAALGQPIEAVFMISYNEPTIDPRFVEQVACLRSAGLPPAVLTNGTGLTPDRIDTIRDLGGLAYLSINLSTLDAEQYRSDRGHDHLTGVLANVDYLAEHPISPKMDIVVLGEANESLDRETDAIRRRFADTPFEVRGFEANDRAGYLEVGLGVEDLTAPLRGCDHMGSRPIQQLHINPHGQCILCCQDYDENEVVGDLTQQSLQEVLIGPQMVRARRLVYGLDESASDYICRGCRFALRA